jgi:hypothetical protein
MPHLIWREVVAAVAPEESEAKAALAMPGSFLRNEKRQFHVIVQNGLFAPIIPFEGYAGPVRFRDGGLIAFICAPANAVTNFQFS